MFIHVQIHTFIQQALVEELLCARSWGCAATETGMAPALLGVQVQV